MLCNVIGKNRKEAVSCMRCSAKKRKDRRGEGNSLFDGWADGWVKTLSTHTNSLTNAAIILLKCGREANVM